MPRKTKCQYCTIKDLETKVRTDRGFYHAYKCYGEHLKEQEFKQKEREELDELVQTIQNIFDLTGMPRSFYPFLNELRNGDISFGKVRKRYKQGFEYSVISETYKRYTNDIQYWSGKKDFDSTLSLLKYSLAIVRDKIEIVNKNLQSIQSTNENIDNYIDNNYTKLDYEAEYENSMQNKKMDGTDLFDD